MASITDQVSQLQMAVTQAGTGFTTAQMQQLRSFVQGQSQASPTTPTAQCGPAGEPTTPTVRSRTAPNGGCRG